jgi:hypothetical protein
MRGASDVMCAGCGYRTLAMPGFAFDVDTETPAYSTETIMRGERPILLVLHDADGSWHFLDGEHVDVAERVPVQLVGVLEAHPDLAGAARVPPGWAVVRESPSAEWKRCWRGCACPACGAREWLGDPQVRGPKVSMTESGWVMEAVCGKCTARAILSESGSHVELRPERPGMNFR